MNSIVVREDDLHPIAAANSGNKPLNINAAKHLIQQHEDELDRKQVPLKKIRMADGKLIVEDKELDVPVHDRGSDRLSPGFTRLCDMIGAPAGYLGKRSNELRMANLAEGIKELGGRKGMEDGSIVVLSRGQEFVAFDRPDLFYLPAIDVMTAVETGFKDRLGESLLGGAIRNLKFTDEYMSCDIVTSRIEHNVRKGDAVQGGITLTHSFLGDSATTVVPYIFRLVCENGMTVRECLGARKTERTRRLPIGTGNAKTLQCEKIRSLVVQGLILVKDRLEPMTELAKKELKSVSEVQKSLKNFLDRGRMYSENLMRLLTMAWENQRGGNRELSLFAILNTLTCVATHDDFVLELINKNGKKQKYSASDRQRRALASLAGIFANQHVHLCDHCFSMIPGESKGTESESRQDHPGETDTTTTVLVNGMKALPAPEDEEAPVPEPRLALVHEHGDGCQTGCGCQAHDENLQGAAVAEEPHEAETLNERPVQGPYVSPEKEAPIITVPKALSLITHDLGDPAGCQVFTGSLPDFLILTREQFAELWAMRPTKRDVFPLYGQETELPRLQQAFEEPYRYSGKLKLPEATTPETLKNLLRWAQENVFAGLNGILNNYYEGPDEYIGHHRDSIANMVEGAPILTLSFGETKTFRMTRRQGKAILQKRDFEVSNGSIVLIPYRTNRVWHHEVPKSARRCGKRISVTMRAFV